MAEHLLEEASAGGGGEEEGGGRAPLRFEDGYPRGRGCVRERGWVPLFCSVGVRSRGSSDGLPTRRALANASSSWFCAAAAAVVLLSLALLGLLSRRALLLPGAAAGDPRASAAATAAAADDLIQLSLDIEHCQNYTSQWRCTNEALHHGSESKKKVAEDCCSNYMLPRLLKFDQQPGQFNAKFGRCALMGSSSMLKGKYKGQEIDAHNTVIRINRLPDPEFQDDFGKKVSIIFMAATNQMLGQVPLMRDGVLTDCDAVEGCEGSGMVFLQRKDEDCPLEWLKGVWKLEKHSFLGCVTNETKDLGYGFSTRTYYDGFVHFQGIPSSGFLAMLTFAPLCEELNMYGFGGRDTVDGHVEWDGHPLEMEHLVERQFAGGRFWDTDVDEPAKAFYEEWKQHVKKINVM